MAIYDYNLRENANMVAGALIGLAAPVALTRYTGFPKADNLFNEGLYWITSIVASTPLQAVGAFAGFCSGTIAASNLRLKRRTKIREQKESPLVNSI